MYTSGLRGQLAGLRDGFTPSNAGGAAVPAGFCCPTGYHPLFMPQGNSTDAQFPYWLCQSDTNKTQGASRVACPQTPIKAGSAGGGLPTGGSSTGGSSTGVTPYAGGSTGVMTANAKPCPVQPCERKPCPPCVPQPCEEQPCYETAESGGDSSRSMTGLRGMRGLRGCGCGGNCSRCRQSSPCEWG